MADQNHQRFEYAVLRFAQPAPDAQQALNGLAATEPIRREWLALDCHGTHSRTFRKRLYL